MRWDFSMCAFWHGNILIQVASQKVLTLTCRPQGICPFWWAIVGSTTDVRGNCNILKFVINHWRLESAPWSPMYYIRQCKTPHPRGGTWTFPPGIWVYWAYIINALNLVFCGLPHPWIKTVTMSLTSGHWKCNNQVLSLNPRVVTMYLSTLILTFSFFPFHYTFSQVLFLCF